jgi:hypothetical protein
MALMPRSSLSAALGFEQEVFERERTAALIQAKSSQTRGAAATAPLHEKGEGK